MEECKVSAVTVRSADSTSSAKWFPAERPSIRCGEVRSNTGHPGGTWSIPTIKRALPSPSAGPDPCRSTAVHLETLLACGVLLSRVVMDIIRQIYSKVLPKPRLLAASLSVIQSWTFISIEVPARACPVTILDLELLQSLPRRGKEGRKERSHPSSPTSVLNKGHHAAVRPAEETPMN